MDVMRNEPSRLRLQSMVAERGVVPSLNGLRAFSIIIVFLSHTVSNKVFPGGFGVRIFFLISGFLITRLMFVEWKERGRISLRSFYARRFIRLYPVVLIFTASITILYFLDHRDGMNWQEPLSAVFYISNYYYSYLSQIDQFGGMMPFGIFWSLSVEEHFYLIFPVVFVASRADPCKLIWACGCVLIGCLALRLGVALARPRLLKSLAFYYETQYQLDSIGFGVLMATLCEFPPGRASLQRLLGPVAIGIACLLLIAGFGIRNDFFRETIRYSLLSVAILIIVANIVFSETWGPVQRALNTPVMDWIGRLSYSIYVWHFAAYAMIKVGAGGLWSNFPIWLGATLVLASLSYYGVEQPLATLRHRFGSVAPQRALN